MIGSGPDGVGRGAAGAGGTPLAGGVPEGLIKGLALQGPGLPKVPPGLVPQRLQLFHQGPFQLQSLRQGVEDQAGVPIEHPQQALQVLQASARRQALHQMQGEGQHLLLPVVVGDLAHEFTGIGFHRQFRGSGGLHGLAPQRALAEAMDGGDVGGVELFEGQQQQALHRAAGAVLSGLALQPLLQNRVWCPPVGGGWRPVRASWIRRPMRSRSSAAAALV